MSAGPNEPDTYRGWSIGYEPPPIPMRDLDWRATGPNYDAWTEGEGHWTDNGQKASAAARELAGTIGLHRQAGHVQTLKLGSK